MNTPKDPKITLRAGPLARARFLLGYRAAKLTIAGALALALAGGIVWQWPAITREFFAITGFKTSDEMAEAQARTRAVAKLEVAIEQASLVTWPEGGDDTVKAEWENLQSTIAAAKGKIRGGWNSIELTTLITTLDTDTKRLSDAYSAQKAREKKVADQAEKKRLAAEKAAAKRAADEQARRAAEAAAQNPGTGTTPDPGGNGGGGGGYQPPAPGGGGNGGGGGGGGYTPPAVQPASQSLSLTCSQPEQVTFSASGGGTVTISAGGASNSGPGGTSVTVTVSGSITATATGSGSVSIGISPTYYCH